MHGNGIYGAQSGASNKKEHKMAKNETVRIRPGILKSDEDAYTALPTMQDYNPANTGFSKSTLTGSLADMQTTQQAEVNAQNALDAARDAAVKAEWNFHDAMLGVKAQVVAQYGDDSDQAQALGLTKKSERKAPVRKAKAKA